MLVVAATSPRRAAHEGGAKLFRGSESRMQFSFRRIVVRMARLFAQVASLSENDDWIQLLVV